MLRVFFMLECDECHQAFERVFAAKETTEDQKIETWIAAANDITCGAQQSGWKFYPCVHICYGCSQNNEQIDLLHTDIFDPDFDF